MCRSDIAESDKFLEEEILNVRLHRAKCTLPTLAQHEGFDVDASRRALRAQGGWKGKQEDLMPDSYLRSKQLLALKLQESCLLFLRGGGRVPSALVQDMDLPLFQDLPSEEQGPDGGESDASGCSLSSGPSMDFDQPEADDISCVPCLVGNPKSGCYHRVDTDEVSPFRIGIIGSQGVPLCHVKGSNFDTLNVNNFERWRSSRPSYACTKCFPSEITEGSPCKHICGKTVINEAGPDEVCAHRCQESHSESMQIEHDCGSHDGGDSVNKRIRTD